MSQSKKMYYSVLNFKALLCCGSLSGMVLSKSIEYTLSDHAFTRLVTVVNT